jgi:hypothetical protein
VKRYPAALAAAALVAVAAVAASGGDRGARVVARVGGAEVTSTELARTVEHFREEARREGRDFPREDTRAFRQARQRLLGLLVYRLRLREGAAAEGITLRDDQVRQRLQASAAIGGGDPDATALDPFALESVRAQLLLEAVYRQLADPIRQADPERRQAERNAALEKWLDGLPARFPVRVEATGY